MWSRSIGGAGEDFGCGVAVDSNDMVWATGYFAETVNLGNGVVNSQGGTDAYLGAYAGADGAHVYSAAFGDNTNQGGHDVQIGAGDVVHLTGWYEGGIGFGSIPLTNAGADNIFVAKLANDGSTIWARGFGGTGSQFGYDQAIDTKSNLLVSGIFDGALPLGNDNLSTPGVAAFVAKLAR